MALPAATWYVRITATLGYTAVTKWATGASIPPGTVRRQNTAPAVNSERCFVATQSATGTTGGAEPTWVLTKGAATTDNTVTWTEATGQAGMNGDLTNCPNWTAASTNAIALGYVIQNNAGTFLFICTTAGTAGSGAEPTWNTTAGQTTADNTVTWTSIGAVGGFGQWAAPHARLNTAFTATWSAAGDTIYIGSDHAETSATTPLNCNGTVTSPIFVYSIPTGTIPPTATSAGASVTFATANVVISSLSQTLFMFGVTFSANGTVTIGQVNTTDNLYYDTCTFKTTSTSTAAVIQTSGIPTTTSQRFSFRSCTFVLANASQSVKLNAGAEFVGCTFYASGTVPTTAFTTAAGSLGAYRIRDCDISTVTGNLLNISASASGFVSFENCKLGAGVALSTGTPVGQSGVQAKVWNCDSAATNYRLYVANYMATLQQSTSVFRAGGASDGVTPISWQIASTVNCEKLLPYVSEEIALWNASTDPKTATIYLTCAGPLTNNDVYIELEYLGSATSPIATVDLTSRNLIGSSTALTTDGVSTWTGGLGNNYQIGVTFTAHMRGVMKCRVYVGKPSVTINVDPVIVIS